MKEVRRIRKEKGAVVGLPLYILIAVVVAAVSLAVILSFMVSKAPTVASWDITPPKLYCKTDNTTGKAYFDPSLNNNTDHVTIKVYDENGNPLSGVQVKIEGCGIHDADYTNGVGVVSFNVSGVYLDKNVNIDYITVTFTYQGTLGEESKTTSIPVIRK